MNSKSPLTIALPKGRLTELIRSEFAKCGLGFTVEERKLTSSNVAGNLKIMLVKNADLPAYVHYGIAGLGVCGEDVLNETDHRFYVLKRFPFGSTDMCIAGKSGDTYELHNPHQTIATKYPKYTREYFGSIGIPVEVIKLNGSVELAPTLGLSRYIVDLVQTGGTLVANDLVVFKKLVSIGVVLIANVAYYKIHYNRIDELVNTLNFKGEKR